MDQIKEFRALWERRVQKISQFNRDKSTVVVVQLVLLLSSMFGSIIVLQSNAFPWWTCFGSILVAALVDVVWALQRKRDLSQHVSRAAVRIVEDITESFKTPYVAVMKAASILADEKYFTAVLTPNEFWKKPETSLHVFIALNSEKGTLELSVFESTQDDTAILERVAIDVDQYASVREAIDRCISTKDELEKTAHIMRQGIS